MTLIAELLERSVVGGRGGRADMRLTLPIFGRPMAPTGSRYGVGTVTVPPPPIQVPPNSDLTLGMVCIDKSSPGGPSGR